MAMASGDSLPFPLAADGVAVIAEVGVNHNGRPEWAHRLVDEVADAGADCVKFQTFVPALVASRSASTAAYQEAATSTATQQEMLADLVLPRSVWSELKAHAEEREMTFLSTAFDTESLELLLELGVDALKVPSGEIDNLPFIRRMATYGMPLIMSTGATTLDEVQEALAATGDCPVCLLHCVTAYPAPISACNLLAIPQMAEACGVPVGWSDHTVGSVSAIAAVALGAPIIEKHVTLDNALPGPDHAASADLSTFSRYVADIRATELALGSSEKQPTSAEQGNRVAARRSHHAARPLAKGQVLGADDTILLRPAVGISPAVDLAGRVLRRSIDRDDPVLPDDLEPA